MQTADLLLTVQGGGATWGLWEGASASLTDCVRGDEFVPVGTGSLTISGTDGVMFWLTLPDASVVDTTLPPPGTVDSWSVGPGSSWASGIPYTVSLTNCTNVWWGVMAQSGCDGTFRDSTLRAVGAYFTRSNAVAVRGVANNVSLVDTTYSWGDVALRFVNSSVQSWNFYPWGTTQLTLETCVFGELIVSESGQAWVQSSLCDGSGGYMGVYENGSLIFVASTNLSQTTCRQNGTCITYWSALLGPAIDATDNAIMELLNTEYLGEPAAHDAATIFDVAIDPVEGASGQLVPLRGTARMVVGPTSPLAFEEYTLEYGTGENPTTWIPIAGPFSQEVRDATLGTWDTCRIPPGNHSVRVSLLHNFGDTVSVSSDALVAESQLPDADFDCDGDVDLADFVTFAACFTGAGVTSPPGGCDPTDFANSDLDGDNDVDLSDFVTFAANFTG